MTTLRIEHAINDYDVWQRAFDSFAGARAKAGVRGYTIRQPVGDAKYLMLDLEFDSAARARAFDEFLRERVWSSPGSSPALAGAVQTQILDTLVSWPVPGRGPEHASALSPSTPRVWRTGTCGGRFLRCCARSSTSAPTCGCSPIR